MPRIGCFCFPGVGHLNPMSALAHEPENRGHKLFVFSIPDVEDRVRQSNLAFRSFGALSHPPGTLAGRDEKVGNANDIPAVRLHCEYLVKYADAVLSEAPPIFDDASLDLLIVDQMDYAAAALAAWLNLRFVTVALVLIPEL